MILYFADRKMNILGTAATDLPDGILIRDDVKVEDIDSGISTLSFKIPYGLDHAIVRAMVREGNYILRNYDRDCEFYTILDIEDDSDREEVEVYAEDAGLDLLNEIVGEFSAPAAKPVAFYVNEFAYDSGFEIGVNEISDRERKLSWDGEATAAERIRSVATQFDAEIGYRFDIKGLRVMHKYIDLYRKRGKDIAQELRLHREIGRIIEKRSIANLVTALRVTGGTPEGEEDPVTLDGYTYDDGDIYVENGMLFSRSALAEWSRYLSETGDNVGHIVGAKTYEATTKASLCTSAIKDLRKYSKPQVTYEAEILDLPENLKVGDTVRIVDRAGELYLSARLLKMETRASERTQTATLGDYLVKSAGISAEVQAMAEEFRRAAKSRYTWYAYADDAAGSGISLDSTGKSYVGIAPNRLAETPDLTDPSVYTWTLIKGASGEKGDKGEQGAQGPQGEAGGRWYSGTGITGTSTTATIFSGSGVSSAVVGDMYLNTSTFATYRCTVAGAASAAKWVYVNNIKGATGTAGATGPTAQWYYGTALTHTSGTATASVTGAVVGSMYLNTQTSLVYKCTAISGSTMTWTYAGDLTAGVLENIEEDIDKLKPELIVGTHGTTATATWKGTSTKITELVAGTHLQYKLSSAGASNVTLTLTLANGTTTSAIPCYYSNTTRLSTQYGINAVIDLVYDGSAWRVSNPYTNSTYNLGRRQHTTAIKALEAITAGKLICGTGDGYKNCAANVEFSLSYPILYASAAITAGATATTTYEAWNSVTYSTTLAIQSGAANLIIYLKGTVSGNTFTIASSNALTTVEPTTEDGYYYIPLGVMSSATVGYFNTSNRLFACLNGVFQAVDTAAQVTGQQALEAADAAADDAANAQSTANDAMSMANTAKSTADTAITQISTTASDLATLRTTAMQSLADLQAALGEFQSWINFSSENSLVVGKTTSSTDYVVQIEGDCISFYEAGDVGDTSKRVAYFQNHNLYVDNIIVGNQLDLGNFRFIKQSNGNLSFIYTG